MKKSLFILFIGFILNFSPNLFGAAVFEGSYDMTLSGEGQSIQSTMMVKDGNMRMKFAGKMAQAGEMIIRDDASSMLMIMPQQRMYMVMPLDIGPDMMEPEDKVGEENEQMPFKKTGNTKKLLGYTAHEFIYEDGKEKMIIWATEEIGSMPFSKSPMMKGYARQMRKLTGLSSFFPLETIGTRNGKENFRMTVTKVDKKELPMSLFEPPAGYRKMTMPAGMGGFMRN